MSNDLEISCAYFFGNMNFLSKLFMKRRHFFTTTYKAKQSLEGVEAEITQAGKFLHQFNKVLEALLKCKDSSAHDKAVYLGVRSVAVEELVIFADRVAKLNESALLMRKDYKKYKHEMYDGLYAFDVETRKKGKDNTKADIAIGAILNGAINMRIGFGQRIPEAKQLIRAVHEARHELVKKLASVLPGIENNPRRGWGAGHPLDDGTSPDLSRADRTRNVNTSTCEQETVHEFRPNFIPDFILPDLDYLNIDLTPDQFLMDILKVAQKCKNYTFPISIAKVMQNFNESAGDKFGFVPVIKDDFVDVLCVQDAETLNRCPFVFVRVKAVDPRTGYLVYKTGIVPRTYNQQRLFDFQRAVLTRSELDRRI
jgi:hypothetical protein